MSVAVRSSLRLSGLRDWWQRARRGWCMWVSRGALGRLSSGTVLWGSFGRWMWRSGVCMVRWCVLVRGPWRRRCLISILLPLISMRSLVLRRLTICCVRLRRARLGLGFVRQIWRVWWRSCLLTCSASRVMCSGSRGSRCLALISSASSMCRVLVIGTGRVCEDRTASTTLRRFHVPEISRGRLTVTSSLVKTTGAPHWAITTFSIVTEATVVFSHERATGMAIESHGRTRRAEWPQIDSKIVQ
jgi:hypothetical protein